MYEKFKIYIQTHTDVVHDACLIAFLLFLFLLCRTAPDGDNVDRTVSDIKKSVGGTGQSVGDAVRKNKDAEADISTAVGTIDKVSIRIDSSKREAESISAELTELSRIAEQCRERNLRIKAILDEAGK